MVIKIIVAVIALAGLAIREIWNDKKCHDYEWYQRQHIDTSSAQNTLIQEALNRVLESQINLVERVEKIEKHTAVRNNRPAVVPPPPTLFESEMKRLIPMALANKDAKLEDIYCAMFTEADGNCKRCPLREACGSYEGEADAKLRETVEWKKAKL